MKIFKPIFMAIVISALTYSAEAKKNPYSYTPPVAENNTYKGQISPRTYQPKNTYVNPYIHKDGSRVKSHYRSRKR